MRPYIGCGIAQFSSPGFSMNHSTIEGIGTTQKKGRPLNPSLLNEFPYLCATYCALAYLFWGDNLHTKTVFSAFLLQEYYITRRSPSKGKVLSRKYLFNTQSINQNILDELLWREGGKSTIEIGQNKDIHSQILD